MCIACGVTPSGGERFQINPPITMLKTKEMSFLLKTLDMWCSTLVLFQNLRCHSLERGIYFTQMKNTLFIPEQKTPHFTLPSHTITWKQDLSHLEKSFSKKDLKTFLDLYALAGENPRKAKKQVEAFKDKHPDHPEVLNLLTHIFLARRKIRKGDRLIEENYAKNPDCLFAKINFADLCLRRKKPQMVLKIFNNKLNLRDLYPNKKMFHISEFRGFIVLMGFYHISIRNRKAAEGYHYLVARIDPNHPGTKILAKKLYYNPFYKRLILKLFRR